MDTVVVDPPTQKLRDHRLVDLFLRTYRKGHYSVHLEWIKNSLSKDVEVVGENALGERLAVEHTLIENFSGALEKEQFIKLASQKLLDDASLRVPGRIISLLLPAEAFDRSQRWRWEQLGEAVAYWARSSLSALPTGYSKHNIPMSIRSGLSQSLEVGIIVREAPDSPGMVLVNGLLPAEAELVLPSLKRAIENKAPKLLLSTAEKKVLLLELHGRLIQECWVVDQLRADSRIQELYAVALAYTQGLTLGGKAHFCVWYPFSNEWHSPWTVVWTAQRS